MRPGVIHAQRCIDTEGQVNFQVTILAAALLLNSAITRGIELMLWARHTT